jgi:AAA domain
VIGLAPTNAVAQDLKADGFTEASTVHAELFRLKNGRTQWDAKTVVIIVDEAAMLDSRVTVELLATAKASGAKLILAGDDRQLASIERGGLFTELRQRHGAAEISEAVCQRVDWQRQEACDLAGTVRRGRGGMRQGRGHYLDRGSGGRARSPGRGLVARHNGQSDSHAFCVRLHQQRRGRAECRPACSPARPRRTCWRRHAVRDETRRGGVRHRRPCAVH